MKNEIHVMPIVYILKVCLKYFRAFCPHRLIFFTLGPHKVWRFPEGMTLTSNHMVLTQVIDSSDDDCQIVEEVDTKATVDTNKNKGITILRVPN